MTLLMERGPNGRRPRVAEPRRREHRTAGRRSAGSNVREDVDPTRLPAVALAVAMLGAAGCGNAGGSAQGGPLVVDGVRLMRAPPQVHRACLRAARRLHVVIYCPTLVPPKWGTRMQVCAGCNGTFSSTGSFHGPHGYVGTRDSPGWGHFTMWAAPHRLINQGYVGCTDGKRLSQETIDGRRTRLISCPAGSELDSGHVLVEWSDQGWIYALSLHGNTPTNRRLLRVMAEHIAKVA